jgi:hypothetical protein
VVNDIVVEFGDAGYQGIIDRYIAGRDVPYDDLRHVWEDTTMPNTVFAFRFTGIFSALCAK